MLYIPSAFREADLPRLHAFMREHAFAIIASHTEGLHVSHLPLLIDASAGRYGTLLGHFARANPHWQDFERDHRVTCIFRGPHAYISSAWYEKQPSVPTWNYAVVHATGRPRLISDPMQLSALMHRTVMAYDPGLIDPAAPGDLPTDFVDALVTHIVGFEIEIDTIEGKFKLGQNRPAPDQRGIAAGLEARDGPESALLRLMGQYGMRIS